MAKRFPAFSVPDRRGEAMPVLGPNIIVMENRTRKHRGTAKELTRFHETTDLVQSLDTAKPNHRETTMANKQDEYAAIGLRTLTSDFL